MAWQIPPYSPKQESGQKIFTIKNIIIYLAVAAVFYGLIYYFFLSKRNTSQELQQEVNQAAPQESPIDKNILFVILDSQNNSGQKGIAALSGVDGKTKVVIDLTGTSQEATQPAHIHEGSCPAVGDVKYLLTTLSGGKSQTELDVALDEIKKQLPLAVNVHKSPQEVQTYVACGDIK